MPDMNAAMIDAMLMESTSTEAMLEIGRMAMEGALPAEPDEDTVPAIPEATAWAKGTLLAGILDGMLPQDEEPGPITEADPQPIPQPSPLRHAKKAAAGELVLAPPLSVGEIIDAGGPAKDSKPPIIIHNHLPPSRESPAMVALAKGIAKSMEKLADNASKPTKPAQVTIAKGAVQVTTPPVTIAKGAVNVEAAKPANVKIDVHVPKQPKIKGIERGKDGLMTKPIYEES